MRVSYTLRVISQLMSVVHKRTNCRDAVDLVEH